MRTISTTPLSILASLMYAGFPFLIVYLYRRKKRKKLEEELQKVVFTEKNCEICHSKKKKYFFNTTVGPVVEDPIYGDRTCDYTETYSIRCSYCGNRLWSDSRSSSSQSKAEYEQEYIPQDWMKSYIRFKLSGVGCGRLILLFIIWNMFGLLATTFFRH